MSPRRSSAPGMPSASVHRGEQAVAEPGLLPPPASGAKRTPPRALPAPCAPSPSARRTRPRWTRARAAIRTSPVASALSIADSQGGGAGGVVAGLALGPAQAGDLVGLGLQVAASARGRGSPGDMCDGVVEAVLQAGELSEHGVAADVQPRVVDLREPVFDLAAGLDGARSVAGRDRRSCGERARWRPGPRADRDRRRARALGR